MDVREHLNADGKNQYREYRTHFFKDGAQLVLLLLGGDKSTQTADVTRAQDFWTAYQEGRNLVARRSEDWNIGLAKDLRDAAFAREILLASIDEAWTCSLRSER